MKNMQIHNKHSNEILFKMIYVLSNINGIILKTVLEPNELSNLFNCSELEAF